MWKWTLQACFWKTEVLNWLFFPIRPKRELLFNTKWARQSLWYINLAWNRSQPIKHTPYSKSVSDFALVEKEATITEEFDPNTESSLEWRLQSGEQFICCECRAFYLKYPESIVHSGLSRTDSCCSSSGDAHLPPAPMILHHFWWYRRPPAALHPVLLSARSDTESKDRDRNFRLKALIYYNSK